MTNVSVSGEDLAFEVEGWDKLWSLRNRLLIPLKHVIRVYADANTAEKWWKGIRLAGTYVPGVMAAGTFYQHGNWVFWDVHNPENAIAIDLRDEHYAKLVIEVSDPAETIGRIESAISHAGGSS